MTQSSSDGIRESVVLGWYMVLMLTHDTSDEWVLGWYMVLLMRV